MNLCCSPDAKSNTLVLDEQDWNIQQPDEASDCSAETTTAASILPAPQGISTYETRQALGKPVESAVADKLKVIFQQTSISNDKFSNFFPLGAVTYLQHNGGGITLFGFALDRGLLHTLFAFEMTLVLWILSKVVVLS